MEELVAIAKVIRTRGLRGEVSADVLTDFPERFDGLEDVVAVFDDGRRQLLKIEKFWFQKGRIILKFDGIDSIESAEPLRSADICVPESEAVELQDEEYFDWELVGCTVRTADNTIGTVKEVMRTGGAEILVVAGDDKEFLIPFAESICVDVDIENKLIVVDPPEGLLEF